MNQQFEPVQYVNILILLPNYSHIQKSNSIFMGQDGKNNSRFHQAD